MNIQGGGKTWQPALWSSGMMRDERKKEARNLCIKETNVICRGILRLLWPVTKNFMLARH